MTKVLSSLIIRQWRINELLDEEEIRDLDIEDSNIADDYKISENLTERHVAVIIDGWHIRREFTGKAQVDAAQSISNWLDRLLVWILDEFLKEKECLTTSIVAWDAELRPGDEKKPQLASLENARKEKYKKSRSANISNMKTFHAKASWNFCALVLREGGVLHQSGVDARIATDLFKAALDGADFIVLVSNDGDFAQAVKLIIDRFSGIQVDVLSYSSQPAKALISAATRYWQGNAVAETFTLMKKQMKRGQRSRIADFCCPVLCHRLTKAISPDLRVAGSGRPSPTKP